MNTEMKQQIIDAIKGCKKDEKEDVRNLAVHALSLFEEAKEESAIDLIRLVVEGDKRQRVAAKQSLIALGESAVPEVIAKLIKHADDWDARVQGLTVLTEIYMEAKKQDAIHGIKEEKGEDKGPKVDSLRTALKDIVKEALRDLQNG